MQINCHHQMSMAVPPRKGCCSGVPVPGMQWQKAPGSLSNFREKDEVYEDMSGGARTTLTPTSHLCTARFHTPLPSLGFVPVLRNPSAGIVR